MRSFSAPLYDMREALEATRVELLKRVPCWHCGRSLVDRSGRPNQPPYIGYKVRIDKADRLLHKNCAQDLGMKVK